MMTEQSALEDAQLGIGMLASFIVGGKEGGNLSDSWVQLLTEIKDKITPALTAAATAHEDQCDLGDCTDRADTGLCNFHWGQQIMVPAIEAEAALTAAPAECFSINHVWVTTAEGENECGVCGAAAPATTLRSLEGVAPVEFFGDNPKVPPATTEECDICEGLPCVTEAVCASIRNGEPLPATEPVCDDLQHVSYLMGKCLDCGLQQGTAHLLEPATEPFHSDPDLELTGGAADEFLEAIRPATEPVCGTCGGTGKFVDDDGKPVDDCEVCRGTGKFPEPATEPYCYRCGAEQPGKHKSYCPLPNVHDKPATEPVCHCIKQQVNCHGHCHVRSGREICKCGEYKFQPAKSGGG